MERLRDLTTMQKTAIAIILIIIIAVSSVVVYSQIVIKSNSIIITPIQPTLTISANNTSPFVGEYVLFTATFNFQPKSATITFFANSTILGVGINSAMASSFVFLVTSTDVINATANAVIT